MKEDGFSYVESLIALCLSVLLITAVSPVLQSMERGREDRKNETQGYLLARTVIEQWKAGVPIFVYQEKTMEGGIFEIKANVLSVTAMVEKCEVEVRWKSRTYGPKNYVLAGYRFISRDSVP